MNCKDVNEDLLDYLDQVLEDDEMLAFSEHISKCSVCEKLKLEEERFRTELQGQAAAQIDPTFKQKLLAQIDAPQKQNKSGFWQGFGVATAASFMIWMFVGIAPQTLEPKNEAPQIVTASINEVKNVFG